ncbi:hypothetical protein SFRURICE_017742, partial [Spodoptera frugiperda]
MNKLDALQKMAQILIALENNLPKLEAMPEVKNHMTVFHKNLTKVLENVIESNESKKYFTLMEICDAVNRINASIKNLDTDNVLPLASLNNTLRIIQDQFITNVFDSELNCALLTNIADTLVGIQECINTAEETSVQIDSEHVQDIASHKYDETKAKVLVEHIEHAIAAIENVKAIESTQDLKTSIAPTLETICPVLEELKRSVASTKASGVDEEHISDISDVSSFAQTFATPLCELNQNLIVLNQQIVENIESLKQNSEAASTIAEPLHELHTTLEILQQDVISQYGEDVLPYDVSVNMASAVQNLQSCIVMIQEQAGVEAADEMSTLEDISGIKTTAETIPSDRLVLPATEETAVGQTTLPFNQELQTTATAQALQTLNEHITVLQNPEIIDALDTLSEVSDYSSLKSFVIGLGELHSGIEEVLHPLLMEGSNEITNLINPSKLMAIAEPMQELQQSLSVLDTSNIPIYENLLEMPTERIHSVIQNVSEFKEHLDKCMLAMFPAMHTADSTVEIANKVGALREVCEHLKDIIETTKAEEQIAIPEEVKALERTVETKKSELNLTDDVNGCLATFLIHAEDYMQNVRTCLEKIVKSQSNLLVEAPLSKFENSALILQAVKETKHDEQLIETVNKFVEILETAKPSLQFVETDILDEIKCTKTDVVEDNTLPNMLEEFATHVEAVKKENKDIVAKEILDKVTNCIEKHNDYKDATGTGKALILLKCLSDCTDILQESLLEVKIPKHKLEEGPLKAVLTEMLEPLQALHSQLTNVQEQVLKGVDEESISVDISTTESLVQTMTEKHKEMMERMETEEAIANEEIALIMEVDKEIHSINDSLRSIEGVHVAQVVKEITKPVEDIEKSMHVILSSEKANVCTEDKLPTGLLALNQEELASPKIIELKNKKIKSLKTIMSKFDWQSTDAFIGKNQLEIENMKQVFLAAYQLLVELEKIDNLENKEIKEEKAKQIIHHIDQYIELIEIVEEISAIIKIDDIKETKDIAKELRESIVASEMIAEGEVSHEKLTEVRQEQNKLAKKLQTALSALQVQVFERAQELAPELSTEVLQRIAQVTAQLQADLVAVTGVRVAVQAPNENVDESVHTIESVEAHSAVATSELATAAARSESTIIEQTGVVDQLSSSEQLVVTTEMLAKTIAETKEIVASEEVKPISTEIVTENILPETEQALAVEGTETVVIEQTESVTTKEVLKEDAKLNVSETEQVQEVTITEPLKTESVSAVVVEDLGPELHEVDEKLADVGPSQTAEILEAPKATIEMLVQHIDQFISDDLTELINELSNVINVDELKQTIGIAKELRENITASEVELKAETSDVPKDEVNTQYASLAQKLYEALTALENVSLETAAESTSINKDALQRVTTITENLRADLVAVTATQDILDQTKEAKPDQITTDVAQVKVPGFEAGQASSIEEEVLSAPSEIAAEPNLIEDEAATAEIQKLIQQAVQEEREKGYKTEIDVPGEIDSKLVKASAVTDGEPVSVEEAVPSEVKALPVEQATMKTEEPLGKATTETLLQNINEFLSDENIKTIDQISTIVSVDELKQSVAAASDLRENIQTINEITPENVEVLLKLQNALTVVQVLATDSTNELSQVVEKDKLQQVAASSTDLSLGITVVISQVLEQQDSLQEKTAVASPAVAEEKAIQQAESIEDVPVVAEEELKQVEEVEVQTAVAMTDVVDESKEESLQTLKDIDVSLTDKAESIDKSVTSSSTTNEEQSKDSESPVTDQVEVIQNNIIQEGETSEDLNKVPLVTDENKTTQGDKSNLLPKEIDTDTEKTISTQDEKATEISILEVNEQAAFVTAEEAKPVEAMSNISSPEQLVAVGNENTVCIEEDKILPINEDKINEYTTEIVEHVDEAVLQQEVLETQNLITEIGDVQPPDEDGNATASISEEVVEKPLEEVVEVKPTEAIVETKPEEDSTQIPQEQRVESSKTIENSEETAPILVSTTESSAVQEQDKLAKCQPTDAEEAQIASDTTSKEIVQTAEVTETAQVEQLLEEPCSEVIVSQIDSDTDNIKQEKVESLTTENDQISTIEVEIKSETEKTESNVAQESLEQLTSENLEATPIQQELISEVVAVEAVEQQNLTETKETVISETVSELTPDAMLASVASSETVQSQVLLEENVTTLTENTVASVDQQSELPEPLLEKPNENDVANQELAVESPEVVEETKSQTLVSESLPKETSVTETEAVETQTANDLVSKPDQE